MADPRTINIPGNGNATQQYELAPGLLQYVQAVYVEIDNSGGGDTRPVLTVKEQAGVVIAKKRQGESIPAAGSGSASWFLRGTDEGAGTRSAKSVGFYTAEPAGGNPVGAGTHHTRVKLTFAGAHGGVDLLGTFATGPFANWWVLAPGYYCFVARIGIDANPPVAFGANEVMILDMGPVSADPPPADFWATQVTSTFPLENTTGAAINTISASRFVPTYSDPATFYFYNWELVVSWSYVGDVNVSGFVEAIQLG